MIPTPGLTTRMALGLAAALIVALAATGCGYQTGSLHRDDIRTVAVPIFQSREFRRGLEQHLTEELVKMIELRTPYKVTSRERADTVILGTVENLTESVLAEDDRDELTEVQVGVTVTYTWKDLKTGEALRSGMPHEAWHYAPSEGQTLRSAQNTAMRRLAEQIVHDMEADW